MTRIPESIRVGIVCGECENFVSATGIAAFVRALAKRLGQHDCVDRVFVVLPKFRGTELLTVEDATGANDSCSISRVLHHQDQSVFDVFLVNSGEGLKEVEFQHIDWEKHCEITPGRFRSATLANAMVKFNACAARFLGTQRVDVVHAIGWEAGLCATYIEQQTPQMPCVATVDLLTCQGIVGAAHRPNRVELNFLEQAIKKADLLHFPSRQWIHDCIEKEHGCGLQELLRERQKLGRVCTAPFVIDEDSFNFADVLDKSEAPHWVTRVRRPDGTGRAWASYVVRARLDLLHDGGPVYFTGHRLSSDDQKGYGLIRSVFPSFLARHQRALLVLRVQNTPSEKDTRSRKAKLWGDMLALAKAFPKRVAVSPPIPEIEERKLEYPKLDWEMILAGGDCLLQPSAFEPAGLTHREAMLYGSPVIGTRKGDMAERIEPGSNGWLFDDPHDPDAFTRVLEDSLSAWNNPVEWNRMVDNCQEAAEREDKSIVDLYLTMYKNCAALKTTSSNATPAY
jgi:glycogen synthase